MGGKNSFANQVFNPGNIWGWNKSSSKPRPVTATSPTAPPKTPTEAEAAAEAEDYEAKKRKAMGRSSTILTEGLGSGMNTTYSVNKPTLGA
jgi:hypothetical protein